MDLDSVVALLTAPTGKAAFNISGLTINTAFSLPYVRSRNQLLEPLSTNTANTIRSKLKDLRFILIDEISMVGYTLFNWINERLQQIFQNRELFGGISIIVSGDFFQLTPVNDSFVFVGNNNWCAYSIFYENVLWSLFSIDELTECMRQKDDLEYALALDNFGSGTLTESQKNLFLSRLTSLQDDKVPNIFRTNVEVDEFNRNYIAKISIKSYISLAEDILNLNSLNKHYVKPTKMSEQYIRGLELVKTIRLNSSFLSYELVLKNTVLYRITTNINVQDGLANGTTGILDHTDVNKSNEAVIVWLKFENPIIGQITRTENYRFINFKDKDKNLVPIFKIVEHFSLKDTGFESFVVSRKQFPLTITQGMTTYKTQSSTYDNIAVTPTFNNKCMSRNEMYTAFSRVKSAKGLKIMNQFNMPKSMEDNNYVKAEMKRMKTNCPLKFSLTFLQDFDDKKYLKIIVHNIQSLKKNFVSLQNSFLYSADVICLHETWLSSSDDTTKIQLNNFVVKNIIYSINDNKSIGSIIYVNKKDENKFKLIKNKLFMSKTNKEHYFLIDVYQTYEFYIISVYNSARSPYRLLQDELNIIFNDIKKFDFNFKVILAGDFNIDLLSSNDKVFSIKQHMIDYKLDILIKNQISTNNKTQIDL